jgi:uncharacterized protein YjbJ (UPF0337 family)
MEEDVDQYQQYSRHAQQPSEHIWRSPLVLKTGADMQLAYHVKSGGSSYIAVPKDYRQKRRDPPAKPLNLLAKTDWHADCGYLLNATGAIERAGRAFNFTRSQKMNWDRIEGNWKQLKGKAKLQWGKLTDDQLDVIAGKRDQLAGKIQEEYGISKDETDKQLRDFEKRYRNWDPKS